MLVSCGLVAHIQLQKGIMIYFFLLYFFLSWFDLNLFKSYIWESIGVGWPYYNSIFSIFILLILCGIWYLEFLLFSFILVLLSCQLPQENADAERHTYINNLFLIFNMYKLFSYKNELHVNQNRHHKRLKKYIAEWAIRNRHHKRLKK
jgi:hypothetical protein